MGPFTITRLKAYHNAVPELSWLFSGTMRIQNSRFPLFQKNVSTFLTIIPTLWYIDYMVKPYLEHLKHLLQSIPIFIAVLAIAGLGTLKAGQITCEPDCSMHSPKMHQASCCNTPGTSHAKMLSSNVQENHQDSSSDCDGTLCIDSSFEVREIAANVSNSLDTTAASQLSHLSAATVLHSPQKSSGQPYYPEKTIPIYMLTCVYLI